MDDASARPLVRSYGALEPSIHSSVWLAPGAVIVGDVEIGADSSVFYGAVLRGDVERVRVGSRTNVQDQATLHVTADLYPTIVGDEISVGHHAVVHGCEVREGALIGVGAIVLDGAVIGEEALVAAGSVVTPGMVVAPRTLVVGAPASPVRELSRQEIQIQRDRTLHYVEVARTHAASAACPAKSYAT